MAVQFAKRGCRVPARHPGHRCVRSRPGRVRDRWRADCVRRAYCATRSPDRRRVLPLGERRFGHVVQLPFRAIARQQQLDNRTRCEDVFARLATVGAGAQNSNLCLFAQRRNDGRKVQERADQNSPRLLRMIECAGAVGGREKNSFPPTDSGVYSDGELPRSKPSIRRPPRSPPSTTFARSGSAAATASSTSRKGTTAVAPAATAWQMVDEARSRSITTTVRPPSWAGETFSGKLWTLKFLHVNCRAAAVEIEGNVALLGYTQIERVASDSAKRSDGPNERH